MLPFIKMVMRSNGGIRLFHQAKTKGKLNNHESCHFYFIDLTKFNLKWEVNSSNSLENFSFYTQKDQKRCAKFVPSILPYNEPKNITYLFHYQMQPLLFPSWQSFYSQQIKCIYSYSPKINAGFQGGLVAHPSTLNSFIRLTVKSQVEIKCSNANCMIKPWQQYCRTIWVSFVRPDIDF